MLDKYTDFAGEGVVRVSRLLHPLVHVARPLRSISLELARIADEMALYNRARGIGLKDDESGHLEIFSTDYERQRAELEMIERGEEVPDDFYG